MTATDILIIAAILLGPIIAVQLTRYLDDEKEIRERKLWIFKSLMATRSYTISALHVEALNRIDLEFDKKDKGERKVIEAWKAYLDLLGDRALSPEQWSIKRLDMLIDMQMGWLMS